VLLRQLASRSKVLEKGIDALSRSMNDFAGGVESVTRNIFTQSSAVDESASSLEEMKRSIRHISDISNDSASVSRRLDEISVDAIGSIKGLVERMREIKAKSKGFSNLLDLTREISEKTKLLSLNASMEAVHAAGKGSGFTVISNEIRKLADDSNVSLGEIGDVITTLMSHIEESSAIADRIGGNLDKIIQNIRLNSDMSNQLSLAMHERDKGAAEILKATMELVRTTTEIKSTMSEQVRFTEDFKTALCDLQNITGVSSATRA
jgi:methyl-accepting chemotaxis protein